MFWPVVMVFMITVVIVALVIIMGLMFTPRLQNVANVPIGNIGMGIVSDLINVQEEHLVIFMDIVGPVQRRAVSSLQVRSVTNVVQRVR